MTIMDFKNPEQDKIQQTQDDTSVKWRRSGKDRRDESDDDFSGERRKKLKGRRTSWLEIISAIIFPRESKLK